MIEEAFRVNQGICSEILTPYSIILELSGYNASHLTNIENSSKNFLLVALDRDPNSCIIEKENYEKDAWLNIRENLKNTNHRVLLYQTNLNLTALDTVIAKNNQFLQTLEINPQNNLVDLFLILDTYSLTSITKYFRRALKWYIGRTIRNLIVMTNTDGNRNNYGPFILAHDIYSQKSVMKLEEDYSVINMVSYQSRIPPSRTRVFTWFLNKNQVYK